MTTCPLLKYGRIFFFFFFFFFWYSFCTFKKHLCVWGWRRRLAKRYHSGGGEIRPYLFLFSFGFYITFVWISWYFACTPFLCFLLLSVYFVRRFRPIEFCQSFSIDHHCCWAIACFFFFLLRFHDYFFIFFVFVLAFVFLFILFVFFLLCLNFLANWR